MHTVLKHEICMPRSENTVLKYQICMPRSKHTVLNYQICMPRSKHTVLKCQICMPRSEHTVLNYQICMLLQQRSILRLRIGPELNKLAPPCLGRGLSRNVQLIIQSFIKLHQNAEYLARCFGPGFEGLLGFFGLDDAADEGFHLHLCVVHIIQDSTEVVGCSVARTADVQLLPTASITTSAPISSVYSITLVRMSSLVELMP